MVHIRALLLTVMALGGTLSRPAAADGIGQLQGPPLSGSYNFV